MADQNDCSCADRQHRGALCKHMLACRLWMAAFKTGAVAPKRVAAATPGDDLVALLPLGADYLAGQDRPEPSPEMTETALDTLNQERQERARTLRLRGYTTDEYEEDALYCQIVAHIARLEARTVAA